MAPIVCQVVSEQNADIQQTYETRKDSGFIYLPSQRALKDYTHWTKLNPGFNAVVADSGTCNCRFFRLHTIPHLKSGVTYMTPGSNIFFIPDVLHLLKTVMNAWYNSQANRTCNLVVKNIIILFVNVFTYTCGERLGIEFKSSVSGVSPLSDLSGTSICNTDHDISQLFCTRGLFLLKLSKSLYLYICACVHNHNYKSNYTVIVTQSMFHS